MARKAKRKAKYGNDSNGANLGFEATMWTAADKMLNRSKTLIPRRFTGRYLLLLESGVNILR